MKEYPRVKKTVYQPVSFTSDDEVRLEASPVEGWDLNSNKVKHGCMQKCCWGWGGGGGGRWNLGYNSII